MCAQAYRDSETPDMIFVLLGFGVWTLQIGFANQYSVPGFAFFLISLLGGSYIHVMILFFGGNCHSIVVDAQV